MKVLVIGGSKFVGRHIVEQLLNAGWEVTIFNRGLSNSGLFPQANHITGDRDNEQDWLQLEGYHWDAVVDTCGYVPSSVALAADKLENHVGHYVYISTCSVYKDWIYKEYIDESSEIAKLASEEEAKWLAGYGDDDKRREYYGELKALCEQEISKRNFPLVTHVRPCVIAGPYDPTDRFTYWVQRISAGGTVLAPLPQEGKVQYIDVRDLASWMVAIIANQIAGTFNTGGPQYPLTIQALLDKCAEALGMAPDLAWADAEFLSRHSVQPWSELPLWVPDASSAIDSTKALQNGLRIRDIRETIRDTYTWSKTEWEQRSPVAGLSKEREQQLLAEWLKDAH